jgi:NAD(P)-dependent dehydrogenase (short-subunit alcohol dehydrogenase family)
MEDLAGRIAVITGAGSGIGRATALRLGREGAKLHLADIDADAVDAVRAEVERLGGTATAHAVDCSDPAAVEALADAVYAQDGRVDVLHNNAGIGHGGDVELTSVEDWQRVIGVNLLGVAYGIAAFVPRMLEAGGPAAIVNTASLAGLVAAPRMAPYSASKFGVVGMSEALDSELRDRGIRVTALCPGIINTPIVSTSLLRGEVEERREEIVEMYRKRGAPPEAVAEAVVAAIRRPRLVQPVPAGPVRAIWLLKRFSPRAAQFVVRALSKLRR